MRALSIRQPWAWLIIHGGKDIENRTWKTTLRERIYVHAGKAIDYNAIRYVKEHFPNIKLPAKFETGGVIGEVTIADCVTEHDSPWFEGPFGFVLKNPKPMKFINLKGKLGFFKVSL